MQNFLLIHERQANKPNCTANMQHSADSSRFPRPPKFTGAERNPDCSRYEYEANALGTRDGR